MCVHSKNINPGFSWHRRKILRVASALPSVQWAEVGRSRTAELPHAALELSAHHPQGEWQFERTRSCALQYQSVRRLRTRSTRLNEALAPDRSARPEGVRISMDPLLLRRGKTYAWCFVCAPCCPWGWPAMEEVACARPLAIIIGMTSQLVVTLILIMLDYNSFIEYEHVQRFYIPSVPHSHILTVGMCRVSSQAQAHAICVCRSPCWIHCWCVCENKCSVNDNQFILQRCVQVAILAPAETRSSNLQSVVRSHGEAE